MHDLKLPLLTWVTFNHAFNAYFFLLLVLQVAVSERLKAVFTVLVLNTYLQDATIFCDHSGIWNQND